MSVNVSEISDLINSGELEQANDILGTDPGSHPPAEWHLLKTKVLTRLGLFDDAEQYIDQAIELNENNKEASFDLAYTLDLHGEDERAMDLYEACIQDVPLPVNALINLAVLYEDHGRYEDAEACLEQILTAYPNHKRAALFLQDIQSSQNMYYDEDHERDMEKRNAILDIPISDFELSVRSRNCLKKMNINTLGDLLHTTEAELLAYKNFGETSLNEIKAMLAQKGLRLGQGLEESKSRPQPALAPGTSSVDSAILMKPVSELEFSVRSRKCLHRLGIVTLGDLASKTEAELMASKNFGQTSLDEVKQRLAENGLALREVEGRRRV